MTDLTRTTLVKFLAFFALPTVFVLAGEWLATIPAIRYPLSNFGPIQALRIANIQSGIAFPAIPPLLGVVIGCGTFLICWQAYTESVSPGQINATSASVPAFLVRVFLRIGAVLGAFVFLLLFTCLYLRPFGTEIQMLLPAVGAYRVFRWVIAWHKTRTYSGAPL